MFPGFAGLFRRLIRFCRVGGPDPLIAPRIIVLTALDDAPADPSRWPLYRSLVRQTYPNWDMVLIRSGMTAGAEASCPDSRDARVRFMAAAECRDENIASAVALAGEVGFCLELRCTDVLSRDALQTLVAAFNQYPGASVFYSDVVCEAGQPQGSPGRRDVFLKPAWNAELFRSVDYVGGFAALRLSPAVAVTTASTPWGPARLNGALLALEKQVGAIRHIPRVLLTRRSCESGPAGNPVDDEARAAMLQARLGGHGGVRVEPGILAGTQRLYYPLPQPLPRATLVIPTRNGGALLKRCIDGILEKTRYANFSILVVDNGSSDQGTLDYLESLQHGKPVRIIRDPRPFNYSALNNGAVAVADGDVVCLMNDDVEVIEAGWLAEMVSHAVRPEVGAVGAKLLYPDGRIQHAGIVVGMKRSAAHGHKGYPGESPGYMGRLQVAQECTAVTGACLAIRRELYLAMGGLNERDLAVAYNDVDLCLRLKAAGLCNIWTPYALLFHHESASRGRENTPEKRQRLDREADYMNRVWGMREYLDPCYHPGLALDREDFSRLPGWRVGKCWRRPVLAR